jgi:hypothetical protein
MDEHQAHQVNGKPLHETRDATVRYIIYFGIGMAVSVAAAFLVSWGLLRFLEHHQSLGSPDSSLAKGRVLPPPGVPRLQAYPNQELDDYLAHEKETLNTYGWVDKKKGIVRIPIQRAMNILLQNGLPIRTSKTPKGMIQPDEVQQYTVPQGYMPQN